MQRYLIFLAILLTFKAESQTNFATVTYGTSTYNPRELFFGGPDETYFTGSCWIRGSINNEITWSGYCYTPNNHYGGASPLIANTFLVGKNGNIWKNEGCEIFGSWQLQSSGTTDTLFSVKFFSIDTGFICGENGLVLRTFNNGRTWTPAASGVNAALRTIIYTPGRTLFAAGDSGTLIRSDDDAASWSLITTGVSQNITGITFAGNDTGYLCGQNGLLMKSTDGGLSWNLLNAGTTTKINAVDFITADKGFIATDSVRMTTDGGLTWTAFPKYLYTPVLDIKFRDALNGYFITQDKIYRSYDGGQSWFDMGQDLQTVEFPSQLTGYAAGADVLRKTTDGGKNWSQIHPFNGATMYDAFFLNNDTGYVSGTAGSIYKTIDGGNTWTKQVVGTNSLLRSIHFFNANDGIAVGSDWTTVRTSDGGLNWTVTSSPNPSVYGYHDIFFLDNNLGFRCGSQGSITKTTDGGATFTSLTSGTTKYLLKIYFLNLLTGFAIGESGTLLRSVNGGVSWNPYSLPVSGYLNAIAFSDSLNGYIAGESGIFFETKDGGLTWKYKSMNAGNIFDITFSDPYHGYLVGSGDFRALYSPIKGLNSYAALCHGTGVIQPVVAPNVAIDSGNVFLAEIDSGGSDFTDAIVIGAVQSDTSGPYLYFKVPDDVSGFCSLRIRATKTAPVSTGNVSTVKIMNDPVVSITLLNDTLFATQNPEYIYQWYNGFNIISGATYSYLPVDSAGDYRVLVKHGCCSDVNKYITVSSCNGSFVSAPSVYDQFICDSTSAVLIASGGQQYHWYDSDTGSTVLSADTIYVTPPITATTVYYVSAVYGVCESERIPVHIYIVSPPQLPSVTPVTACENEVTYLFSSGVALNWYADTTAAPLANSSFYYLDDPNVQIFVTAANYSCETEFVSVTVTLLNAPVSQIIFGDSTVVPGQTVNYSYQTASGNSIQWTVNGGTFVLQGDSILVTWGSAGTGSITATETNSAGCESASVLSVDIDVANGIGVQKELPYKIYPNPASDQINIEFTGTADSEFVLYNVLMQPVHHADLKPGTIHTLSVKGLPGGIYYYTVITSGQSSPEGKLIITGK